ARRQLRCIQYYDNCCRHAQQKRDRNNHCFLRDVLHIEPPCVLWLLCLWVFSCSCILIMAACLYRRRHLFIIKWIVRSPYADRALPFMGASSNSSSLFCTVYFPTTPLSIDLWAY